MTKEQYINELLSYSDDVYFDDTKAVYGRNHIFYWGDGNTDKILAKWYFEYEGENSHFYDYDNNIAIYVEDIHRFFLHDDLLYELIYKAFDHCLEICIEEESIDYENPDAKYDERKENW